MAITVPPAASTSSRPAMKCDQSAPFTRTSGSSAAINSRGRVFIEENDAHPPPPSERPVRRAPASGISGRDGPFEAPHAGIGIERQDQHIAQRAGLFQQTDVAGMEQIVAAVGEDDGLALPLPLGPGLQQIGEVVETCQRFQCNSEAAGAFLSPAWSLPLLLLGDLEAGRRPAHDIDWIAVTGQHGAALRYRRATVIV